VAGLLHGHRLPELLDGTEATGRLSAVLEASHFQDARHNGAGSPGGKQGDEIPILGRILAVAKALAKQVSSQDTVDWQSVLESLRSQAGKEFHPDIVQACLLAHRHGLLTGEKRSMFISLW
jgi:response regulator RpfG family c-di-GMP phosphodiesterase